MVDPRVEKLADTLVNHSVEITEGERVLITGSTEAAPLIKEIYRKVLQNGAVPITQIDLPGLNTIFMKEANEKQLTDIEHIDWLYRHVDALISIQASTNTKELTNADPEKLMILQKAANPILEHVMDDNVKWVGTLFPTDGSAQDAEMSLEEYEDFVYSAVNVDYQKLKETMGKAAKYFNEAKKVRIVANQTDVTVDIEGREAILSFGKHNVPDGEFYFTPNHLKTEGVIYYEWPTSYAGREIQGIKLVFKEGKIVEYSAEKGNEFLEQFLNTDEGSKYLGELGIGTNFGINKPTKNILFDEKIGGSIHLAVGSAYKKAGKGNVSAIHWDMVKSLKDGGEIYLDGKLIQKNGEWLF